MQDQDSYLSLFGVKSVCGFPKDRMWTWGQPVWGQGRGVFPEKSSVLTGCRTKAGSWRHSLNLAEDTTLHPERMDKGTSV